MRKDELYLIEEDDLMQIEDFCAGLGLALDKIIRSKRVIRTTGVKHPAVEGYETLVHETLADKKFVHKKIWINDNLDEIF